MRTALLVLLVACGGDANDPMDVDAAIPAPDAALGQPDAASSPLEPAIVAGGGVADAPLAGTLHVHAIVRTTSATTTLIVGADVRVEAGGIVLEAVTDAGGRATFRGPDLVGAVNVTVAAEGYAAATWFGVRGGNVTMPLVSLAANPPVPTASVRGTIAGWDALPLPAANHMRIAYVEYARASRVNPGMVPQGNLSEPTCFESSSGSGPTCDFQLDTRTGPQAHVAAIVDWDNRGTPSDASDDVTVPTGHALRRGLSFVQGAATTGEVLEPIASTPFAVAFPEAPAGLDDRSAYPVIDLGTEGFLHLWRSKVTPTSGPRLAAAREGVLADARFGVRAVAVLTGDAFSETLLRDVDPAAEVALPGWVVPPADIGVVAGTASFRPGGAADVHHAMFVSGDGTVVWQVLLLDGRSSFRLPALARDPLPLGAGELYVEAVALPGWDPEAFHFSDLRDAYEQRAGNYGAYTH